MKIKFIETGPDTVFLFAALFGVCEESGRLDKSAVVECNYAGKSNGLPFILRKCR